ncbi:arsenite efflux ATP-binding protein ArsA [Marinococcus luteus]|uniref:Arsenite efflux ATP-binding protein ArsA n=1 Tax=Marinococcus luteus TaxID=1122204 RepID=A0A1H2Y6H7_9BACI|nr:arsenical pump-driving ATPase [Marinococcus luteus]SDX00418.1 arsenite efflux ATP-binding protein ArsA [Marinococcus luteus]
MNKKRFHPDHHTYTRYLFFTGKGGVGKTSSASALAAYLAGKGRQVLLVSTDPASNLDDVLEMPLNNRASAVPDVKGLYASNIDPGEAAETYKEAVVGPYRNLLPETAVAQMEEQLSGACTVEIAAFNEFAELLTAPNESYDHIIFDTAPTGHTLRLLELPSAWDDFLQTSTHGASCLGPLSGLADKKTMYEQAVAQLADASRTTVYIVARPDTSSLEEAARTAEELGSMGMREQVFLVNGLFTPSGTEDATASLFASAQQKALQQAPDFFEDKTLWTLAYHAVISTGAACLTHLFDEPSVVEDPEPFHEAGPATTVEDMVQDIEDQKYRLVFTMGKGGVGKTTMAAEVASKLAARGHAVHLTTTDPADHLAGVIDLDNLSSLLTVSHVNPEEALSDYQKTTKDEAIAAGVSASELSYIEEDLSSPCTEEIAVFQAFSEVAARADNEIVVIDTAPTGHTLLLLEHAEQYTKEIERSSGHTPEAMKQLLPRLKNPDETAFLLLTLPETTPVLEAERLQQDLGRTGIYPKWWVINQSFAAAQTNDPLLRKKGIRELFWIDYVKKNLADKIVTLPWDANAGKKAQTIS